MPEPITSDSTLGDLAEHLRQWKSVGITRGSVLYVVDQVFFEGEGS